MFVDNSVSPTQPEKIEEKLQGWKLLQSCQCIEWPSQQLTAILPLKSGGYMSCPLPTAARTQGASKRVVAQRDAGVADAQWLELLWALRQVHAAGWVDQMRLTMPTLAQSNFGRKWAVQWLGRGAICPRAKWENFEPWDSKKFHSTWVRKNSLRFFAILWFIDWSRVQSMLQSLSKRPIIHQKHFSMAWGCFAAGLAVPRHPHSQDILLGKWSLLQRTTRPSPSNTDGTHGRRDADGLPSLLPTTSNTIRHHTSFS